MKGPFEVRVRRADVWLLLLGYTFAFLGALMLLLLLVSGRFRAHLALTACANVFGGLAVVAGERGHSARRWLWLLCAAAAAARVLLFPINWGL